MLSEPIQAKACTGWTKDGEDVLDEFTVTSFKLRKFSSFIEWDLFSYMGDDHYGDSADFYAWRGHRAYAVMKDGTQIELLEGQNCEPVDLDQVDYVLLADSTKLIVPENGISMDMRETSGLFFKVPLTFPKPIDICVY